jgi:hypothetical protein
VTLRFDKASALKDAATDIRALQGVDHVEVDEATRCLTAFPRGTAIILTAIGDLAGAKNWPLEQLHLESGRMDEVFRKITQQEAER